MRIAHVVLSLDVGGQERLILNLSRALALRGHDVHVVSLTEGGGLRAEFGTIPTHDVARTAGGFEPWLIARLARAIARLRPDAVHTHNAGPLIYAAPAARAARVKRVVHTKHGNNEYSAASLFLARAAAQTVSAFVPVSEETAVVARQKERPRSRLIKVIRNGIPLAEFGRDPSAGARVRAQLGIPEGAVVVGSVGRLVSEKDYPLLVRAMAPLLREGVRLVLVGEGPARPEITAAISPAIAPFVTLTGVRSDVPDLLGAFDIFVLSSRTEGLPLVVPEAMASSLPVVATAVGGLPGIVPKSVGSLVPHGDASALTVAIAALVNDEPMRRRMGDAAQAYAHESFSIERMTLEYETLYAGS